MRKSLKWLINALYYGTERLPLEMIIKMMKQLKSEKIIEEPRSYTKR